MRISDWSSDVCSSDLRWDSKTTKDQMTGETQIYVSSPTTRPVRGLGFPYQDVRAWLAVGCNASREWAYVGFTEAPNLTDTEAKSGGYSTFAARIKRSEEHTSELQSLMRISYAVFCLKKKKKHITEHTKTSPQPSGQSVYLRK